MKRELFTVSIAVLGLGLAGCKSAPEPMANCPAPGMNMEAPVQYEVTFTGTWTEATHPLDYPEAGLLTGPHFSGLIGASHGEGYVLFGEGVLPSPGIERLSEEGKHAPLDEEIKGAIARGSAKELFETGPIKDLSSPMAATVRGTITVDREHSLVSMAAMIAPSPDWFAGLAGVRLLEDGKWVEKKELLVQAWDSGGDRGTTYKAADQDTDPKEPSMRNQAPQFAKRPPVGKVTFVRK